MLSAVPKEEAWWRHSDAWGAQGLYKCSQWNNAKHYFSFIYIFFNKSKKTSFDLFQSAENRYKYKWFRKAKWCNVNFQKAGDTCTGKEMKPMPGNSPVSRERDWDIYTQESFIWDSWGWVSVSTVSFIRKIGFLLFQVEKWK